VEASAVTVDFERRGRCGLITINRPQARNAVNADVAAGIEAAIDQIEADDDLWVGILTGVAPVFCAGADLKEVRGGRGDGVFTARGGFGGFVTRTRAKPIIAAVDGPALAGGAELVLAADLVVASRRAAFGIPEVKRCLIAGAGGLFRLARKIPENVAMECALTGDPLSAARALQVGLVNELVEDGQAVEAALALADRIIANSPLAVRQSRRVILATNHLSDEEGFAVSTEALGVVTRSVDFREGLAAFIEKRAPVWTGR
jgi:enoyl-CoA hydratase